MGNANVKPSSFRSIHLSVKRRKISFTNNSSDSSPSSRASSKSRKNSKGSLDSSTTASTCSVQTYSTLTKFQDGRSHHNVENCPYMLPNDIEEIDRLQHQHYICRYVLKGNYHVPLDNPERILDVATGTGIWALETASEFPDAQITGVDISATYPTEIKPSNVNFLRCNILEGLPFPDDWYDFIYQRLLVFAFNEEQWPQVIRENFRVTKPGGWIQLVESDGSLYNGGRRIKEYNHLMEQTNYSQGVNPYFVSKLDRVLKQAGFVNVNVVKMAFPAGSWGGKPGFLMRSNVVALGKIWYMAAGGRTVEEYEQISKEILEEVEEYKTYFSVWVAYGQKPML